MGRKLFIIGRQLCNVITHDDRAQLLSVCVICDTKLQGLQRFSEMILHHPRWSMRLTEEVIKKIVCSFSILFFISLHYITTKKLKSVNKLSKYPIEVNQGAFFHLRYLY